MRMLSRAIAALFLALAPIAPGAAQVGSSLARPDIQTDLLIGGYDQSSPESIWVGVRVRLGPSWKTYWRSPGDSGLPSEFNWSKSSNLAGAETLWPVPHRLEVQGIETIGYTGEVVFPVRLKVRDPAVPTQVSLTLALYACSSICVRDDHVLTGTIQPGERVLAGQAIIDSWRKRLPGADPQALSISSVRVRQTSPPAVEVTATARNGFVAPDLFVESDPPVFSRKPQKTSAPDGSTILTAELEGEKLEDLRNRPLRVTLVDGQNGTEASSGPRTAPRPEAASGDGNQNIWLMLAIALLGGFVLNLMPCVFPVLSLKFFAFVGSDGRQLRAVRAGFAASAAGIVASFLALATAMVGLKAIGATVGWGIQFQQPVFLAIMAMLLVLFAANLLGMFEIGLPSRIATALGGGREHSLAGHFGSGFVATLLATPCSAPFVGTAVGFALARGTAEIYLVFAALGLGMALPYLVVVAVPKLAALLPRPGRWMLVVKKVMAFGLLATAVWLLSLVGTSAGLVAAVGLGTTIVLVLAWLGFRQIASRPLKVSLALAIIGAPLLTGGVYLAANASSRGEEIPWQAFDEQKIKSLVSDGRTVLVDITAAWCVTCKVNKAFALSGDDVRRRLSSDVVPIQGDWTQPDPRIAAYLQTFGRYGIPFNVVYGPRAPDGIILPELLTKRALMDAFAQAQGRDDRHSSN